jgi:expansin (peptidoglycan-binding protein)
MSEAAFSRVANPAAGTVVVSYRLARDPRLPGPLEVRVAPAATSTSLVIQVINHGNPLSSVAVGVVGPRGRPHWQPLGHRPDDYWVAASGAGAGPFNVQVTDIFGHQVVLHGIRLAPGALQRTAVLMYSANAGGQQPSAAPASGPASPPSAASASGTASPPGAASASGTAAHGASRSPSAAGPGC